MRETKKRENPINASVDQRNQVAESTGIEAEQKHVEEAIQIWKFSTDNAGEAIFWIEPDAKIFYVNEAACRSLGYSREELLSMTVSDIDPNFPSTSWLDHWRKSKEHTSFTFESIHRTKDGRIFPVEVTANYLEFKGKEYHCTYVRDITERKQAVQALRTSESRAKNLVELNIVGVLIADISGKVLEANSAFLQMVGYTREDLLEGKFRWDKMTPPEYHNLDASAIKQLRTNGIFPPYEKEYVRKDGKRIPVIISGATLEEDQEKGVAFVIDLSERKQSEERIKEQAELLNKTQDAIIVLDLENRIRFCNIRTPYFYGLEVEPEELVGKKVYEVVYEADSFKIEEAKRTTTEKGKWKGELHQKTKDGKELIVQSQWTLVRDGYGRPKSILIVNSDVSEKKKLETQFLRAQRLESLGILAGGIAHDLNNVLHPIMMALQLLRKKITDEQGANWINTLEVSAERGADLVKQILSFARGMEGEHRLLQLRHLISEMQKILKDTLPKSIEIHTDFPTDLWTIIGDPTQLHQVLMNLCLNSQDAMPHGGRLSISGENLFFDENYAQMNIDARVGPYIVITVSDTGTGIPPEIVERIFEPFFTTKEPGKGTGLGLSTAFGIVKSHGGFMHVYSEVGKGTRVKVYLPIIETTEIRGIEDKNIKDLPIGRGELILVIDDEAAIRDISSATLKKYGYRVITANDGADGLALYVQNKLEIKTVIVDMAMPIMNGRATIQALRKINPDIKIIAISGGQHEENHVEAARRVNANTFLFKPFTTETLLKTLKKVLLSNPEV